MKNKFMRSVTAMVVAVTMLISSQGVVTSFADGGDHSDMSESSSVQMNEVDNNGTDQSTENGTGEDAAVKDVVEMINALPAAETITEETNLVSLKDQVNAARAAYDALSDDQKAAFNADVLGKLTALEVKISELESNDQETKPSDAVQAVVDAISALPAVETITEETDLVSLKDQVNAARAAYDALSAEQKESFDATVLEKLTALEAKISELESSNQETEPSEAVQNVIEKIDAAVEQIDYTTETITATDGTTVTKTHITMLKDLDPANNAELKAFIDKEAAHEQDENQPALTDEEAAKLSDARKAFEDAKAKYLSLDFSNAQLAARQAYDALAEADKTQVTNYSLLEAMEANIAYIMQAVNTLPTSVAEINGILYDTLDEAIADAEDGDTIEVLQDCTTQNGFSIFGKSLTIDGNNHAITVDNLGIYLLNNGSNIAELTFKDCRQLNIIPVSGAPTTAGNTAGWGSVIVSFNCILTFDNCTVNVQQPSGETGVQTAFYSHTGAKINIQNGSTVNVTGFKSLGFGMDPHDTTEAYTSEINIKEDSHLNIDKCGRGIYSTYQVTIDDSTLSICNNREQGTDGTSNKLKPDYIIQNSTVEILNNGQDGNHTFGHGMCARDMKIVNSNVKCEGNGGYGLNVTRSLTIDTSSTLDVIGNSWAGDDSGLQINNGAIANIAAGATVNIKGNKSSGLSNWGTCNFEEGSKLTITGNINDKGNTSRGGGIYNTDHKGYEAHLTLPSDAVICNNQAVTEGDDIYNTGEIIFNRVGSDWTLEETNLPITGWYYDGHKNGDETKRWKQDTQEDSYQLFDDFDDTGRVTLTGTYALKAAHAYAYDPETPVNPTDWEHSKSKTATNLDANYQSQVTLSLPAAQEQLVSDVVFVLDESSAYDAVVEEMDTMLNNLADHVAKNEAAVKVGVVVFRGNAVTKDLELLTPDSIDDINAFVRTRPDVGGSNMMAGLQAAEAMLQNAPEDDSRKYMILIGDGITYTWSGENGEQLGVNFANADAPTSPMLASPDAFDVKHGNGYLPNDWSKHLNEVSSVMEKTISEKSSSYSRGVDISTLPFIRNDEKDNYTSSVDIALYKCDQLYRNLSSKYHCYTVMRSAPSLSDPSKTDGEIHPWGPSFMNYLANGKEVSFAEIQNDIYYLLDAGSQVVDVIGEGIDNVGNEYDFKFIDEADKLTLKVGNEVLPIHEENGYYGFGEKLTSGDYAGHYPYELTYYPEGMGTRSLEVAGELFRWDINVPVSNFAPVQLTYTVQLTHPQTADGTYGQYDADGSEEYAGLYTNKMAILYPVDSNGVEGEQEAFQKPTVSYSISNGKPVDPPVDPEDPTPRPGGGGDEDDDTPTIINDTPVPTTTIDDENVPLTDLPDDTVTIDDEEVPLKDIPNTGDMIPVPAMVAAVISIGGIALLMKKHK